MKIYTFRTLLPLLMLFLAPVWMSAANIYVLFDDLCMDRLEYEYINQGSTNEFVVYQIKNGPSERINLEVGTENQNIQESLPAQYIGCGNIYFDRRLVEDINNNIHRVFLIVPRGARKYSVMPVSSAAIQSISNNKLTYIGPDYQFSFNMDGGTIGEDISLGGTGSKVFFEGKMENACSGMYLFRQKSNRFNVDPLIDLVISPEVGVLEERSGKTVDDALDNTLRLVAVDGDKLDRYLKKLCSETPLPPETVATKGIIPAEFGQPAMFLPVESGGDGKKSEGEQSAQFHQVKKGDTLYGISKEYGVTVSQLRDWNNLGKSNLIRKGENLRVTSPVAGNSSMTGNSLAKTTAPAASNPTLNTAPAPYEASSSRISWVNKGVSSPQTMANNNTEAWQTTNGYHQARPGETAASLAMKYGFTEARFRDINNLGKDEVIKIGQYLKTTDCRNCPEYGQGNSQYKDAGTTNTSLTIKSPATNLYTGTPSTPQAYESFTSRGSELPRAADQSLSSYNNLAAKSYETPVVNPELPAYKYRPMEQSLDSYYPASYNVTVAKGGDRIIHVVEEGENLFTIARKYGTTVEKIRALNNLDSNEVIIPYQRLYVR